MPYLQIDSQKFLHNYQIILNTIAPKNHEKIAIVLKDNAYGHGLKQIAELAKRVKIQSTFVKNTYEALEIINFFHHITILYPDSLPCDSYLKAALKAPNIYFCAPSLETLQSYPQGTKVELKVDSGMHRNGIAKEDLNKAFSIIAKNNLNLKGIFTHIGFGDDFGSEFYTQNMEFSNIKQESLQLCTHYKLPKPRFHSLSSSGAFHAKDFHHRLPQDLQDDLFRIGIAFYGYLCQDSAFAMPNLQPIAALFAKRISTLNLKSGARIGYSGASALNQESAVSTYDIGYGDGLFRLHEGMEILSAEGFKILPRASMDCISIESTQEEICIFNDARIFARAFNTIPYEILSHLHAYIPKIII
ncbi:alanine racemase [uncultured Helicobacter sp.]|uniref:alanine racemase n=1 Tax=uncultured Helicobacter sp. TaxID=175537 RepID=UPI002613103C|nr:alanine racemase [uncultured Helicobacter sp.]